MSFETRLNFGFGSCFFLDSRPILSRHSSLNKAESGTVSRILIIVQNLPVPLDRRVWLECLALRSAGHQVSVICPKGGGTTEYEELEGVRIRRYEPPPATSSFLSFLWEFVYSWFATAYLTLRCALREGFDVIQACNPPDTYWALALPFRLFGKKFVFDQHDLCPEVYLSRFPEASRIPYRVLLLFERATYATADHVIATNDSYREVASQRGHLSPEKITVVRTGPDANRMRAQAPRPELKHGRQYLCCYLGVMGPQDGVDLALRAAAVLVNDLCRRDVHFTFVGGGDSFDDLRSLARELSLDDYVDFTGRAPDDLLFSILSTADLGLCPDPLNPLNDVSTMNKTMEYMAFGLPVVAFDLKETRVSAAEAALYAPANDVRAFAGAISTLLDDPGKRAEMGRDGRKRVEDVLAWKHQVGAYLRVYDRVTGFSRPSYQENPS